jgi:hypothetical protein
MYSPDVLCRLGRQSHRLILRLISIHIYNAIILFLVIIHKYRRRCRSHAEISLGVARVELSWFWFSSLWLGLFMSDLLVWLTARSHVDVSWLLEVTQWLIGSIVAFASGLLTFSSFFVMIASRVLPSKPIGVWSRIWL